MGLRENEGQLGELRWLALERAQEKNLPPFVIFSDRTLRELASRTPTSLPGMRTITGVGDTKLRQYGKEFVALIARYLGHNANQGRSTHDSSTLQDPF